jgi:hypothetical protein
MSKPSGEAVKAMRTLKSALHIPLILALIVLPMTVGSLSPLALAQTPAGDGGGAALSEQQLLQLVAPIALYPDPLVAQILAASTNPMEIVEAARWLKNNSNLKGEQLTQAIGSQSWDSSVKALAQVPSVLQNMNKNLSWTSALGDAYSHQSQDVMNAIQVLRGRAATAGTLKSTPQQKVSTQPAQAATVTTGGSQTTVVQPPAQTIIIEPANPQVVYVPAYNPTSVYGQPVPAYPGYSSADLMMTGLVSFGMGMMVGSLISGGGWGCNWHGGTVIYNHTTYIPPRNIYAPHGSNYWTRQNAYNNFQHNQQVTHRQQGISNYQQHRTEQNRQQAYNNYENRHGGNPDSRFAGRQNEGSGSGAGQRDYGSHARSNGYAPDRSGRGAFGGSGTPGEVSSWSQRGRQSLGGNSRFGGFGRRR